MNIASLARKAASTGGRWACIGLVATLLISASPLAAQQDVLRGASAKIADTLAKSGKKSIAVVDFTDLQGNVTELGRFLAEQLSVSLAIESKGFDVVDRTHLKALLQEHKLSASGLIDPQTARKLGQIAGVDALATGSLTPLGDSVNLTLKVLDTNTARMITATAVDIPRTKAIEELLSRGLESSSPSGPSTALGASFRQTDRKESTARGGSQKTMGEIARVDQGTCYLNVGSDAGVKEGDEFDVFRLGSAIKDPNTGEVLGHSEVKQGRVRVDKVVGQRFSTAHAVTGAGFAAGDIIKP